MSYEVTPGNVKWVAENVLKAIGDGKFNHGEVLLGVAEALGRIVVSAAATPVQGVSAMQVIVDHLNDVIKTGYMAKGYGRPLNG